MAWPRSSARELNRLAAEVLDPPPPDGEGPRTWEPDAGLLAAARTALGAAPPGGPRILEGRLVTARAVLGTGDLKRAFGERHGSLAVDMESAGAARAAGGGPAQNFCDTASERSVGRRLAWCDCMRPRMSPRKRVVSTM